MSNLRDAIKEKNRPLTGAACQCYEPVFLEIIAGLGYDAAWIEMEHAHITFQQAADLCRIASGLGLLTMIRIPDSRRENVLKAAECGPDILDMPMANSPEPVRELVFHARYAPEGGRGFFGASRAVGYGLGGPIAEEQARVNRELCLMAQIETREAADRANEIVSVPGLDAILLGPGDMSASFGVPGQLDHPYVTAALKRAIAAAKAHGRIVAMATSAASVGRWVAEGVQVLFCTGDVSCMRIGASAALSECRSSLDQTS